MDFDDSFFEESTSREKKITLQPYDARHCEKLWFMSCIHLVNGADSKSLPESPTVTPPSVRKMTKSLFEPDCDKLKYCADYFYHRKSFHAALCCALAGIKCAPGHRPAISRDMTETVVNCLLHMGHVEAASPLAVSLLVANPNDLSLWQLVADCFFCAGRLHDELLCRQRCIWLNHITFSSWLSLYAAYTSAAELGACRGCSASVQGGMGGGASKTDKLDALNSNTAGSGASASSAVHAQCSHTGSCSGAHAAQCATCSCLAGLDSVDYDAVLKHWTSVFCSAEQALRQAQAVSDVHVPRPIAELLKPRCVLEAEEALAKKGITEPAAVPPPLSRVATVDLQVLSSEGCRGGKLRAIACLAHARCHLELSCYLSSSFARRRAQAILEKVVNVTKDCQPALDAYADCRRAFSLAAQNAKNEDGSAKTEESRADDNEVYGRVVTPQRNTLLHFQHTWFPWFKDAASSTGTT